MNQRMKNRLLFKITVLFIFIGATIFGWSITKNDFPALQIFTDHVRIQKFTFKISGGRVKSYGSKKESVTQASKEGLTTANKTLNRNEMYTFAKLNEQFFEISRKGGIARNGTMQVNVRRNKTTHIAFLKVHKAGSSCMANMFSRFALKYNLNVLLPKVGVFVGDIKHIMPLQPSQHFDIFASHTVYNETFLKSQLPADTVNIGIVRNPAERMISAAYYFRDVGQNEYLTNIPKKKFIHNLVMYPEKHDSYFFSKTRNSMARDFGFPKNATNNETKQIRKYLDYLNKQFLLVLVLENLNESLILLKRLLNWSISDILYLPSNVHKHETVELTNEEEVVFRRTSFLDIEIYEYFKDVLDKLLKVKQDEFWTEVHFFENVLKRVSEFCSGSYNGNGALVIEKSAHDDEFSVSYSDCNRMKLSELTILEMLRERHMKINNIT